MSRKPAGVRQAAIEIDADRRGGAIGAEGIERAVRDVEDFHDAEDQRQADRDEEQIGRVDQAVGQDGEGGEHEGSLFLDVETEAASKFYSSP